MSRSPLEGTVIAQHGRWVRVQCGSQTLVAACRRRLQWQGDPPPAPQLVVGDRVLVEPRRDRALVIAAHSRRSSLLRRSPKTGQAQVIAANVDQALVTFAAEQPEPNRGLLDRFLVACHLAGITAVVVINKSDLGTAGVEAWLPVYRALGYRTLCTSALCGHGIDEVGRQLQDRITLLCGPSGVGKSSLLNAIVPGLQLKVGSVSECTGKGRHTTSRAELLPLPGGGFVVDTPGLKEFGLWDATPEQLQEAFPDIAQHSGRCHFANCTHSHEPGCLVSEAVETGTIDEQRYRSYRTLSEELISESG